MVRKTIKLLALALIAAFALSSAAEAAPKKTRHRVKHSSRVWSGAVVKAPAAKKQPAAKSRARANATPHKLAVKKAPATRRPTTKPR